MTKFLYSGSDWRIIWFFAMIASVALVILKYKQAEQPGVARKQLTEVTVYEKSCKCNIKYITDTLIIAENFAYFESDGNPKIIDTSLIKNICYK